MANAMQNTVRTGDPMKTCEHCGWEIGDINGPVDKCDGIQYWRADPFDFEINEEVNKSWFCYGAYTERSWDI